MEVEEQPVSFEIDAGPSLIEKLYKDGQVPTEMKATLQGMYSTVLATTSLDIAIAAELCLSDITAKRLNIFITYLERLTDKHCSTVIEPAWQRLLVSFDTLFE